MARAPKKEKPPPHVKGSNCWLRKHPCNDVCKEHEEPRGECSMCPPCPRCELQKNQG